MDKKGFITWDLGACLFKYLTFQTGFKNILRHLWRDDYVTKPNIISPNSFYHFKDFFLFIKNVLFHSQ